LVPEKLFPVRLSHFRDPMVPKVELGNLGNNNLKDQEE
jgi:hypothetical protein